MTYVFFFILHLSKLKSDKNIRERHFNYLLFKIGFVQLKLGQPIESCHVNIGLTYDTKSILK